MELGKKKSKPERPLTELPRKEKENVSLPEHRLKETALQSMGKTRKEGPRKKRLKSNQNSKEGRLRGGEAIRANQWQAGGSERKKTIITQKTERKEKSPATV